MECLNININPKINHEISIVMGYYNRLPQFSITLDSINKSSVKDNIEVIVVDDGSSDEHIITKDIISK